MDKYIAAEEEGGEPLPALAHVFSWEENAPREVYTANADNSITSYTSILFGNLSRGLQGVVLDGAKANGSMTTQVFYVEDGLLKNGPPGVNAETYQNPPGPLRPPLPPRTSTATRWWKSPWLPSCPASRRAPP